MSQKLKPKKKEYKLKVWSSQSKMSDYLTQYEYDYQDLINKLNKTDFKQDMEEDQEEVCIFKVIFFSWMN